MIDDEVTAIIKEKKDYDNQNNTINEGNEGNISEDLVNIRMVVITVEAYYSASTYYNYKK